jgi:triosephosphate isomerase (TIM)
MAWGAQDVSAQEQGAYTGEVAAAMLREFGCRYVIVGHSERRQYHGETDELVAAKAQRALARASRPSSAWARPWQEREAGQTEAVVKRQLAAVIHTVGHCSSEIVVAYEPVWAIGTGKTATPEQAQAGARGAARPAAGGHGPCRSQPHPVWRQHECRQRPRACWPSPISTGA